MIPWEDNFGKLTKKQKELIIGCLLGDGRLESRSIKETARLRIHHADSQKNYLFWKYYEFKSLTIAKPKRHEYIDKRNQKKVVSWYFHTKTLVSLRNYYCLFYKNRKKIIPKNLELILSPFSLAVWIMDDGCFYKQSLILNTQGFSVNEQKFLQEVFRRKYSVKAGIHKDRNNFRLYFKKEETDKLRKIISPFFFSPKFIPVETDPRTRRYGVR